MFGGLTKTSSRIVIAAAFGLTLGGYALSSGPALAADFGGDCCADLEERVAELEATTVRKGNKKVSVTLSGWVVKVGTWWDDGAEQGFYVGDKDTTLSSHFQISGSAIIAPGWSGGYTLSIEATGGGASAGFAADQFNDDIAARGDINTLLSYMWIKSDKYGTLNWGRLSQATDNVALLPDLSGTVIESNAVLFDGGGMFTRPKGFNNAFAFAPTTGVFTTVGGGGGFGGFLFPVPGLGINPPGQFNIANVPIFLPGAPVIVTTTTTTTTAPRWTSFVTCITAGGGVGADCNGYPQNAVRYDTPTFGGFSLSSSYGEDNMWDVALKYAADWNSFKVSAAGGYTNTTDEGCIGLFACGNGVPNGGGGGAGFQQDVDLWQVGASVMHVPSGLFVYGLYQNEDNNGTQWLGPAGAANNTDVWYAKAGIKRTWMPLGATVLYGEFARYEDQFSGLCGGQASPGFNPFCLVAVANRFGTLVDPNTGGGVTVGLVSGSEVERWGLGVVQEIDSAAMHVFARYQHLDLDFSMVDVITGGTVHPSFDSQDLFQVGGVIFF